MTVLLKHSYYNHNEIQSPQPIREDLPCTGPPLTDASLLYLKPSATRNDVCSLTYLYAIARAVPPFHLHPLLLFIAPHFTQSLTSSNQSFSRKGFLISYRRYAPFPLLYGQVVCISLLQGHIAIWENEFPHSILWQQRTQ